METEEVVKEQKEDLSHLFQRHQSGKLLFKKGNQIHKPKGSISKTKALVQELIGENGEKIAKKLIAIALDDKHAGQMTALKICMDRLAPPQKAIDIRTESSQEIKILVEGIQQYHNNFIEAEIVQEVLEDNSEEE